MTQYESAHSDPTAPNYVFSYHIQIVNQSEHTVQLLRRYWKIVDGFGSAREVEGDGVVGQQPILAPGESYSYSSWCSFISEIGIMKGYFEMVAESSSEIIRAKVPEFTMQSLGRSN